MHSTSKQVGLQAWHKNYISLKYTYHWSFVFKDIKLTNVGNINEVKNLFVLQFYENCRSFNMKSLYERIFVWNIASTATVEISTDYIFRLHMYVTANFFSLETFHLCQFSVVCTGSTLLFILLTMPHMAKRLKLV